MRRRRVLYVTGTRAEFGLMGGTLRAIQKHKNLDLQLVVTGMHLSRSHGHTVDGIRKDGWAIDATVPWRGEPAQAAGLAIQKLASAFDRLNPDIVLVTGDRIEPFAAAVAARIGQRCVAHVHGGDRALGQLDDSLRHAITKLANLHLPATRASAERIYKLGEERLRIHVVGTPGLDGVKMLDIGFGDGAFPDRPFVLVALHPDTTDESQQFNQASALIRAIDQAGIERGVVVYPNNDPGWEGIAAAWQTRLPVSWVAHRDLARPRFLSCLRQASLLIGNSSSGIIEAASLGTPVLNIGNRQLGRERSKNVVDVSWQPADLKRGLARLWNNGRPKRFGGVNVYGKGDAGKRIAAILADVELNDRLMTKLIRY